MSQDPKNRPPINLPLQLKLLNAMGPLCKILGIANLDASGRRYIRRAQKKTGLEDLGAYPIEEPLQRMLKTMKEEAGLSLFGRISAEQMVVRNLMNNLLMAEEFKANPAIAEISVEDPIIITCTPRTGSTLLHNLMALHPDVRAPKMWELHRPLPPPAPETEFTDERIKQSDNEFGRFYRLVPEMRAIHFFAPEAIEECTHLFGNIFTCRFTLSTLANTSSYSDWIFKENMVPAYETYKKYLQILSLNYPGKFLVLKSPGHILQLQALEKVFPKAKIIHLHRDPATAAGSFCSLAEAVQIAMRRKVDPLAIGDMWKTFWGPAMINSIEWRKKTKLQVMDINFKDMIEKPEATVTTLYNMYKKPIPDTLGEKMQQYLQDHPKDEYGIHEYSLVRYGLCRDTLYKEYQPYIDTYRVPLD